MAKQRELIVKDGKKRKIEPITPSAFHASRLKEWKTQS